MRLREAVFQLHWLLGISAGLVLALVGATGAVLSFEDALLARINPGVLTVEPRGEPLSLSALVLRIAEQRPGARIQSLTLSSDPRDAASVVFAPDADAATGPGGRARGERRQLDPYSGQLLAPPRGEGFFRATMQLHRWLAAGDTGKQVVAASTVALVYFCLSGLYLRWPRRRWRSLRAWLALDWRQRGRAFLWQLHAVAGTWVLLAYLVMALSGLWWSYGWYREGLQAWAGVEARRPAAIPPAAAPAHGADAAAGADRGGDGFDPDRAWRAFIAAAPDWGSATLSWPSPGGSAGVRYLERDAPHERAWNTLAVVPGAARGEDRVEQHQRYADKPLRQKVVGSVFAVHRGSFFGGAVGVWIFLLASLAMPLFAVTGWMLYLKRRAQRRARALPRGEPVPVRAR